MNEYNSRLKEAKSKIDMSPKSIIGELSEKKLHAILKNYYCNDKNYQEQKIGKFYADIYIENEIIEIQTKHFNKLREKLTHYFQALPSCKVTIVYPIFNSKILYWINMDTGEISAGRKSPKPVKYAEIFYELYKIKPYLLNDNLQFCFIEMKIEEYRHLNGYNETKKRGSSCYERIPLEIVQEIKVENKSEYRKLVPSNLPKQFTSKDYAKLEKVNVKYAQLALNILAYVGIVAKVDKIKNAIIYELVIDN